MFLDEKGRIVNGRTEKPNKHDILTASRPDGTAAPGNPLADIRAQGPSKALAAAATARSASTASARGISAHASPENGSSVSNHRPECGSTQSLSMKSR